MPLYEVQPLKVKMLGEEWVDHGYKTMALDTSDPCPCGDETGNCKATGGHNNGDELTKHYTS